MVSQSASDGLVVLRYAAFAAEAGGGNPAGVVLDTDRFDAEILGAEILDDERMQRVAAEVGYSETAFVRSAGVADADADERRYRLRFFSPAAEVPFCGHATVATAVALAERDGVGSFVFETMVGAVAIDTAESADGIVASFTSVEPEVISIDAAVEDELLSLLDMTRGDLDERFPIRSAFAGNWHPIVVVARREVFDSFGFDPVAMRALMDREGWRGMVSVLFAADADRLVEPNELPQVFEARNLFPVGSITEDPATGSAAASLGGYLRELGVVRMPTTIEVRQGAHVGAPSLLRVSIPESGGITVSGGASPIE